jgi:hypothetical protein
MIAVTVGIKVVRAVVDMTTEMMEEDEEGVKEV